MATLNTQEVGPRYDCGIVSPTFGGSGFFIKPGTFNKAMQTQLRDEVVASATASIVDRDIALWKRISQTDWTKGKDQIVFTDPSRFRDATAIDIHTQGQMKLVPAPAKDANSGVTVISGRGGRVGSRIDVTKQGTILFPWTNANVIFCQNPLDGVRVWTVLAIGGAFAGTARVSDIETDGTSFFCAMVNAAGIGTTPCDLPAAFTQYDTGIVAYHDILYDSLKKILYGITNPGAPTASFNKINAGGAATVIYDFVKGRLDAIELYLGNVIVAWNSGVASTGTQQKARLYKYDGTTVLPFAEMPDGSFVTGLLSYLGVLFVAVLETDPYTGTLVGALYSIIGGVGPTRIGTLDAVDIMDTAAGTGDFIEIGNPSVMYGTGTFVFIPIGNILWVYDLVNGGLSRCFGSKAGFTPVGAISGAVATKGRIFTLHGGAVAGGVELINGTPGIAIVPAAPEGQMIGSRMDAGLPYVNKFWYGWETVFKPLLVGDQIAIDYSLDDAATFTACTNSPLVALGGETRLTFLIQKLNPHALYRATLTPANGDGGPIVVSVAAKYIVVNVNASVYQMTVDCYDLIRSRGNKVEDAYAADALAFLDQIARQNELVTFYEPDDPTRTPHTCWVMSAKRRAQDTSHVFDSKKNEGEVDVVLWETI